MDSNELRRKALVLPPVERAALIEDLMASFDPDARQSVDEAWAKEAESRLDAFTRGEINTVSLDELKRRLG